MEDKRDNLSSTLEVMKDFFLNSGMLNNSKRDQGNTPKKRQGGGDRDCQAKVKRKKSLQEEEVRSRDHAGQVIRQAEAAKAHIFVTPGNVEVPLLHNNFNRQIQQVVSNQVRASFDENYIMVGANIDAGLQDKIKRGEYVDFSRLLPRDRQNHDDHRLEIVYKGGPDIF